VITSKLLESVPEERLAQAQALISDLQTGITDLRKAVDTKDKEQIILGRAKLLNLVSQLEDSMVQGFPTKCQLSIVITPTQRARHCGSHN